MSVLADQYGEARHANIQTLVSESKRDTFGDKNSTSKDRDKREQQLEEMYLLQSLR